MQKGREESMEKTVKDDCIFCKIANGEISSNTIYEDEHFRVIMDINPASKGHCIILRRHMQPICMNSRMTGVKR